MSLLDKVGLQELWGKIKNLVSSTTYTKTAIDTALNGKKSTQSAVSDPAASGTGVEFISGISQNAQGVISPSKKTVRTMGPASADAAGSTGLVPAPAKGKQAQFLRGDGTWQTPTNTKNTAGSTDSSSKLFLIGATSQAASPQTYSQDTAYVGTDGCLYSGGAKVLTAHQDISGKKSTQSAVSDPTASGTGVEFISGISQNAQGVISPSKKTVRTMGSASADAAGSTGLVPAPAQGDQGKFLNGAGQWSAITPAGIGAKSVQTPVSSPAVATGTSQDFISDVSQNANGEISVSKKHVKVLSGASASADGSAGLVPFPHKGWQNRYLRGDGAWQVPDDSEVASTIDGKTTVEEVLSHHSRQIDNLESGLTIVENKTQISDISLTFSSQITVLANRSFLIGSDIKCIQAQLRVTEEIPVNTIVATLPTNFYSSSIVSSFILDTNTTSTDGMYPCFILNNELTIKKTIPAGYYAISAIYR